MLEEGLSHSGLLMLARIKQVQDTMFPWEEVSIDSVKQHDQNQPKIHPAQAGEVGARYGLGHSISPEGLLQVLRM